MKNILFMLLVVILSSCNNGKSPGIISESEQFVGPATTALGTLKIMYSQQIEQAKKSGYIEHSHFMIKHGSEIVNNLEIVETDTIPGNPNLYLIFYKYTVGANTQRGTDFMRVIEGKWYSTDRYYSDYDEDPFRNGHPKEAKELLKKKREWDDYKTTPIWEK